MFGRAWRIGRIAGIPVNVDSSWVWIAVLAVYSLWSLLGARYSQLQTIAAFALAVLAAALFFGSVFLHELAHAVAARLNRIEVSGITLVFFGGYTSTRSDERGPGAAFVIAAVGPATSLALGGLFVIVARLVAAANEPLAAAIGYVGAVNVLMAIFNVIPGFPLDGGRMLEAVIWRITRDHERGTRIAAVAGIVVAGGLVVLAFYEVSRNDLSAALWAVLIASMIFQGARAARGNIELRRRLADATVADAMDPPPLAVPADMTLSEALDRYLRGREGELFPVIERGGNVVGVVSFGTARPLGVRDPLRPVREAMVPLSDVLTATEEEPLDRAVARLGAGRAALVLRDGRLVGTITGNSIGRWAAKT